MSGVLRKLLAPVALLLALLLALGWPAISHAQVANSADWTNLNLGNFQAVNSGTTLNVSTNQITITTARVTDGDSNDANFTGFYSSDILSYYSGSIGSQSGVLLYSMDHSVFDSGDYFETVYSFDTAVTNLAFVLANIDRYNQGGITFHDAVSIEYDTGNGSWVNLVGQTSRYSLGSVVGTSTIGGTPVFHGTGYSGGTSSSTGNINVNLGTLTTKRLRIRYRFGQVSPSSNPAGNYQYMGLHDFAFVDPNVSSSDLSLNKSVSNSSPVNGATLSYTLSLTNNGPSNANGVVVRDILPTGFTYASSTGFGTYDPGSGQWSVTSIPSGQTRIMTITGTASAPAGVTITNIAEVFTSPNADPDSTPNNNNASEDDQASASFTVQGTRRAGTPPVLSCSVGTSIFDWDAITWNAGSLSNSYAVGGIGNVGFTVASSGTWVFDAGFGGQSPSLSNVNTGGFPGSQLSLHQYLDFDDIYQTASTTITLPVSVPGLQFTVLDVDFGANDFADKLTVYGTNGGATVYPTLTNGVTNYVVGNTAVGDSGTNGLNADGNVVVTFTQAVDTVVIVYGNANTAPPVPDGQAIAIHDITFCQPATQLDVTKISSVLSDPVNGTSDPKAIPGAIIDYCVTIANNSGVTTSNIVASDPLPASVTYVAGSMTSGASCGAASTAEDDNNSGSDESDSIGASVTGTTLTAITASLAPGAAMAIRFRAIVN